MGDPVSYEPIGEDVYELGGRLYNRSSLVSLLETNPASRDPFIGRALTREQRQEIITGNDFIQQQLDANPIRREIFRLWDNLAALVPAVTAPAPNDGAFGLLEATAYLGMAVVISYDVARSETTEEWQAARYN